MIKILIVDDHKLIRDGITSFLSDSSKYEITDEVSDGLEAINSIKQNAPDLIITDLNMPNMDGMELISFVKKEFPSIKIIVLSMVDETQYIRQVLKLGANGYLLKNSGIDEVKAAIDAVMKGNNYYGGDVMDAVMTQLTTGAKKKKVSRFDNAFSLTKREKEILKLIIEEYNNGEIAEKLFISIRTVDAHKRNMIEKTGSKNMAGLLVWAINNEVLNDK
ncbi:response regulator [Acidiluteibacter ferrifornacis]|uniref:Response regulator n=1 Tax=Acidiluteibacter ferrifornacis TaxID=2692424 RepID=A0A6N9NI77_9FLAO|nr:response regulator transcription factor [Acidiluteibacter ferrifornacis]NBG66378.1 response regulator [Acidiluteibacter ferrifornacis]